ncbi:MAG: SLC13 family permease [Clostridia bacterium]|nr:SLC13 family permease [Clostridia bacterium]
MKAIIEFAKRETVLVISFLAAMLSMCFVKPDKGYLEYIDMRTIGLLFSLMAVIAGFSQMGIIRRLAEIIVKKMKNTRALVITLWSMCFISSMLITNDVSLITFVPLAIAVLNMCGKKELIIYTVVLQTVAANLGSMLTPMGNPQNLYIYNYFNVDIWEFLGITIPVIILSFILLMLSSFVVKGENINVHIENIDIKGSLLKRNVYICLGILCIMSVVKIVDYRITVFIAAIYIIIFDRKVIFKIDWFLLLTFCMFFVFTGNIGRIYHIRNFMENFLTGREFFTALLGSQIISNVPAAVMLSGFTDNYRELILGTDVGGLGTLIASLASLISFKLYSLTEGAEKGRYLMVFTAVNIIFLIIIVLFCNILK